jgi:trimethylamine---corrinoid protein Co-methyltransferase
MMNGRIGEGNQIHLSVLPEEGILAIHLASLEILERTGVFVELPRARDMLRGAGANVDAARVRIPSHMVDGAIRSAPRRVVIGNRDGERYLFLEGNRSYHVAINDCPQILDPFTRLRRRFVSSDYPFTARVVDASPHLFGAGCGGNASDYPPEVRAQVAFKFSILNMKKCYMAHPLDAQQMSDIFEMAAVIAGGYDRLSQAPFVIATAEPTSPLSLYADATEILLLSAERTMPVVWYPMPSAGTTAPSTPAAVLAIGNAEVLAGLVIHQLQRPGAPFIYGGEPGMTDMRSTQWAYGSPDFAIQLAAMTDLAHYYGLPMFGTAGNTDALSIDQQAAAEVTTLFLLGQLSGANLIHNVGLMAGGNLISPEMIYLCNELIDMTGHATHRIDTSPEELAVDLIDQVGPQGNYLALGHTLANFRRFWHSDIFLRNRLTGTEEDEKESVNDRINRKTREIIENHEVEPVADDVLKELDELENKWMSRVSA